MNFRIYFNPLHTHFKGLIACLKQYGVPFLVRKSRRQRILRFKQGWGVLTAEWRIRQAQRRASFWEEQSLRRRLQRRLSAAHFQTRLHRPSSSHSCFGGQERKK